MNNDNRIEESVGYLRMDKKNAAEEQKKIMRKRVLNMLKDPNPVNGIYAMYGAHKNPPIQCRRK